MAVKVKTEADVIYIQGEGQITDAHIMDMQRRQGRKQELPRGRRVLCDLSEVTDIQVDPWSIKMLADIKLLTPELYRDSRVAVVAVSDVVYGTARMYQILASDLPQVVEIFRDRHSALTWLGLAFA